MLASRLGGATRRPCASCSARLRDRRVSPRHGDAARYDFANEYALASRTRQGSPGVNIMTPLRIAGTDTAVLVNRGWVYAPDAMTVDLDPLAGARERNGNGVSARGEAHGCWSRRGVDECHACSATSTAIR